MSQVSAKMLVKSHIKARKSRQTSRFKGNVKLGKVTSAPSATAKLVGGKRGSELKFPSGSLAAWKTSGVKVS